MWKNWVVGFRQMAPLELIVVFRIERRWSLLWCCKLLYTF